MKTPLAMPHRMPFFVVLSILACGSCSRESTATVYRVRGKVEFQGRSPTGAVVVLHPVGESAAKNILPHGTVAADGSFAIGTYKDDDGAPPGEYSVTMSWAESKLDPKGTGDTIQVDRFLGQYSDPTKSRWKVQIREGDNTIGPFVLE